MLIEGVKIATSLQGCKRDSEIIGNRMHSGDESQKNAGEKTG